jgi:DNA-cytosine methyltransferase
MNILSLFDGISCARIALDNLGVKVDNYFASEIDKHAIDVSKSNYPNIIQLGDIRNVNTKKLPKIDLLVGGSPCQDLSNAQQGLGLDGKKSGLFYEYIKILKEVNPTYFLLENVKNKWANVMNEIVGVDFVEINSAKFSAQSRPRYYWTNIKFSKIPNKISSIVLENIVEKEVAQNFYFVKDVVNDFIAITNPNNAASKDGIIKAFILPKEVHNDHERQRRVYSVKSKSPTILARADTTKIFLNNKIRKLTPLECERLQCIPDNYTIVASNTQRYKMIGNAFTVSVIEHIFQGMKYEPTNKKAIKKLTLFDLA